MTTANKITLIRIAMIPLFMIAIYSNIRYSDIFALVIFIAASVTDGIDGYIARKYNQITNFGKFIDPLADKLLVTAAILVFTERGQMPAWAAMLIIAREFAVTGLRLVAVERGQVIAAGTSGKIKTVVSIIAISVMLTPWHDIGVIGTVITVDMVAAFLMVATTLWSGIEYFIRNVKLLDVRS